MQAIKRAWARRYDADENAIRDHRVFFNLSTKALDGGGAANLLETFGGETIYMGLLGLDDVMDKLRTFGSPLVVRCRLKPSQLHCAWRRPAALVWLSAYHATVNPEARIYDVDAFVTPSVPPREILSIESPTAWFSLRHRTRGA